MQTQTSTTQTGLMLAQTSRYDDPLRRDAPDDAPVVTTRRGLSRVALVASETAARFVRGGIGHEPMAWMLSPRRMFDGRAPLDACLDLAACERAIALHCVDETLDADPGDFDCIVDARVDDPVDVHDRHELPEPGAGRSSGARASGSVTGVGPVPAGAGRLFTAVVHDHSADGFVQAFAARVTPSLASFCSSLGVMYGDAADDALVLEGFDPSHPLVAALVSPAIAHVLAQVASDPSSPLGEGLDVRIEQRFLA